MKGKLINSINKIFLAFLVLFFQGQTKCWGQTTLASEDFENTLTGFSVTTGAAAYYSGNTDGVNDRVAASPFAVLNTYSLGKSNSTLGITSSSIVTTGYSSISMTLRLASFSIGSIANGADAGDIVTVEISPDGGTTFYSTARVLGNTNAYWSYAGGTGNASTAYDGDNTPVDFAPAGGGARTTDGYSTITISSLPAVASLIVRITLLNNAAAERWCIDNFIVTGTPACTAPTIQATSIGFASVTSTGTTVSWTRGNGTAGVLVVAKAGGAVSVDPTSGVTYTANASFGSGDNLGSSNFVVYKGTGTSVAVSSLTAGITYHYAIYEYNTTGLCIHTTELAGSQATTGSAATDYFRSLATGNWNTAGTWQSSPDNSTWMTSTIVPTSAAAAITVQTGHTITINADASAPSLTIAGTGVLTFDGVAARAVTVTGGITISAAGGSFITQSVGTFTNTLSVGGDISNAGTFDMSRGGTTLVCTVTFNKNGNQSISGAGATTRFSYMGLNMGAVNTNILEITSSNFAATSNFLDPTAGVANLLVSGTLKLSGSFTYSGCFFQQNSAISIVSTAGIWINNSNVTITGIDDSYDLKGLLRITAGTLNVGTAAGNSIKYDNTTTAQFILEGGVVNIAGRFSAASNTRKLIYTQTGGTLTVNTLGSNTTVSKRGTFEILDGSTFTWTAGSIIIQNGCTFYGGFDYYNAAVTPAPSITAGGGTLQIGNGSSSLVKEFYLYSTGAIPNLTISSTNSPYVYLFNNMIVTGNITIASGATLDVQTDPLANAYEAANVGTTLYGTASSTYDISLTGNWSNAGTFTSRSKKVTFNGGVAQTINGTATTTFYDLTIANTSGDVALSVNATVGGTLTMTTGDLVIATTKALTINDVVDPGISGGSSSSMIVTPGTASVIKNYSSTTSIPFPLGNGTLYKPLTITPSAATASNWTVSYTHSSYSDVTVTGGLDKVSHNEYWTILQSANLNSIVQLPWISSDAVTDYTVLQVSKYNGTDWAGIASSPAGTNTSGNLPTTAATTVGTSTSYWTIGTTTNVNALPLSLLSFKGNKEGRNNELFWVTASEINNDFFTIEKSIDGTTFEIVGNENGAGNSNQLLTYSFTDYNVQPFINYYRLKQTDFDGESLFSEVISIDNAFNKSSKEIVMKTNALGQEVNENYKGLVVIVYSDGTSVKVIQ